MADVSERKHVPVWALILMLAPALVVSAFYAYTDAFKTWILDATLVIAVTFFGTAIAATVLPWAKKRLYESSPMARYTVAGIPLITVTGFLTAAFLGFNLYPLVHERSLPVNNKDSLLHGWDVLLALVIHIVAKVVRSQGIDLSAIHKEIRSSSDRARSSAGGLSGPPLASPWEGHAWAPTIFFAATSTARRSRSGSSSRPRRSTASTRSSSAGPHGEGVPCPDPAHERWVPRIVPGARRGDRRRWARSVHGRPRAARLLLEGLRAREYEAVEGDPMAKHGLFHELASERLAGWIDRAEDQLQDGHPAYLTGGNDDEPSVLGRSFGTTAIVIASEGRLSSWTASTR